MTAPNFKLEKQSSSTVVFRKGATTLPGQLQAEYQTRNTTKPRSSAELFSPGWTAAVYSDHKSCSDIGRYVHLTDLKSEIVYLDFVDFRLVLAVMMKTYEKRGE